MEKQKNTAIEFWRFIFCIALAIGHLNMTIWKNSKVNLLFNGYYFVAFFIFLSGYFLMANYQKNKKNDAKEEASARAWNYTKKRINALYPVLLGGIILAFITRNVILETNVNQLFTVFMNSIWEFLGLGALGVSNLWNEPLVYISAIFISGFIIYYLLSKNEDVFRILALVFAIIVYGSAINSGWVNNGFILGIPSILARIMAGMGVGALMYYPVSYFKDKKFNENITMVFSIAHITLAMIILYIWVHGASFNELAYGILIFFFTFILLVNKDYISAIYNDLPFFNDLGKISLYYFASHMAFIYLLAYLFPEMGYVPSIVFNILFTICWAYIMMYIDDYIVSPIFRQKKDELSSKKITKKTVKRKAK